MQKRRLPLLKEPGERASGDPPRSPWQWVGFGTVAIFVVWVPVLWFAAVLAARLAAAPGLYVVRAAIFAVALALGAVAGGFLVGRWGTGAVGVREAALAGLSAALLATVFSWVSMGPSPGSLATVVFAVPSAALGGWLGARRRARLP